MATVHEFDAESALVLKTLGAASVVAGIDHREERALGPGKPLALITYLAFSPGRAATRDALLDLLWSDVGREPGLHAMRQTLWYIKKRLGEQAVLATRDIVRIAARVSADRDEFLKAVEAQQYETAISLYRGDFLPELALPGAVEFEHWADLERQHLRSAFLRAGQTVVRAWLSVARHKDAVTLARRLRDTDQSEANWRLLLESLVAAQDRVGAVVESDALERFVAAEQREPEPATAHLLRLVRETPIAFREPRRTGLVAELVGRQAQFAALTSAWDHVREHGAIHVHINAPAGYGKSRLLADFTARLRSQRARVAIAAARPGERLVGYSLLSDVAAALAQLPGAAGVAEGAAESLVALNPSLSSSFSARPDPARDDEALRRRSLALRELLSAISEERPVALCIDDWQWADDASQRALSSVLERVTTDRVLVVTTGRAGYASPATPHTARIGLSPLTRQDVAQLLEGLGRVPAVEWAARFVQAVHEASSGSPLLLLATLQSLIDRGVAALENDEWRVHDQDALEGIAQSGHALRQRLASLDATDQEIVLAAAIAGVPMSKDLICRAIGLTPDEQHRRAESLEHRGFLARRRTDWEIAHDMIGEAALTERPAVELQQLHRRLGVAWIAERSPAALLQGGRHLLNGSAIDQACDAFAQWIEGRRRGGDTRTVAALVTEFAGPDVTTQQRARLTRATPLSARLPRRKLRLIGSIAAAAALVTAVASLRSSPPPPIPDAELLAIIPENGDTVAVRLPLYTPQFLQADGIDVGTATDRHLHSHYPADLSGVQLSPDFKTWVGNMAFPDTGELDLVEVDVRSGKRRRLTNSRDDDGSPNWSPDGAYIVFGTGRFDARNHSKLGILDRGTGSVRQLTHGSDIDGAPVWNPRGDVIAFARAFWQSNGQTRLCLVDVDGGEPTCPAIADLIMPIPLAWTDPTHLLVENQSPTRRGYGDGLAIVDVRDWRVTWIRRETGVEYVASPNGQWAACLCVGRTDLPPQWRVFALDHPDAVRDVYRRRLTADPMILAWMGPRHPDDWIAGLDITNVRDTISDDVETHLSILATLAGSGRRRVAPERIRWTTSDTTVATVDTAGSIHPRRIGTVRIVASAGGWVSTVRTFVVAPVRSARITEFEWRSFADSAMLPYGDPQPFLERDSLLGRVLIPNGDGSFASGVISRAAFDGSAGLGFELRVSYPRTEFQWQFFSAMLTPNVDADRLARWDRRTGAIPTKEGALGECGINLPGREGPGDVVYAGVGSSSDVGVPKGITSGAPFLLRVQLFPDGRCGVAINGTPIGIKTTSRGRLDYRVELQGAMVHTRIAMGRLELWSGVRPGVDWKAAPRER